MFATLSASFLLFKEEGKLSPKHFGLVEWFALNGLWDKEQSELLPGIVGHLFGPSNFHTSVCGNRFEYVFKSAVC